MAADNLPRIAGLLLVAAGLYQLTPVKRARLVRCRTPLSFMVSYWRDGRRGAISMGLRHGLFCLGCCWVLFLVLLPLGVMNVAAMIAVTALVFAEKVSPHGQGVARVAAAMLIAYGLFAVFEPAALPTYPARLRAKCGRAKRRSLGCSWAQVCTSTADWLSDLELKFSIGISIRDQSTLPGWKSRWMNTSGPSRGRTRADFEGAFPHPWPPRPCAAPEPQ